VISNERTARELGWCASTPLHEGVRRYLAWLEPERAPAPEPVEEPVPDPVPAVVPVVSTRRLLVWPSAPASSWPSVWIVALAGLAGTSIPSMLAFRSDDFGTGQGGYVAVTCLIAILAALSLLPLGPGGRRPTGGGVIAGWLLAGYVALETMPWTRHFFNLGMPHKGTIALSAIGIAIALLVAAAALRWRGDEDAATDTVS
jgi:hypothetical protein